MLLLHVDVHLRADGALRGIPFAALSFILILRSPCSSTHTHTQIRAAEHPSRAPIAAAAAQHALAHLQEGRLLQHAEEFWEIIPHLLVHGSHEADLPHRPGSVRAVAVRSLHLRRHGGGGRD